MATEYRTAHCKNVLNATSIVLMDFQYLLALLVNNNGNYMKNIDYEILWDIVVFKITTVYLI